MPRQSVESYLKPLLRRYPQFAGLEARLLPASGQFNTVLCLDEKWIFRFPKSAHVAADLEHELKILPRLQGRLPLPIPQPAPSARDPESGRLLFMGYPMLPGEPLLRDLYAKLRSDQPVLERIAADLAHFLRRLHGLAPASLGLTGRGDGARGEWTETFAAIREQLYPFMRADARDAVDRHFNTALKDTRLWRYQPCLIHGDFGAGNILYQAGRVSGIIDFSFCDIGDPAQDLGALRASYGDAFIERIFGHYPKLRQHLPRAHFYCGAYALLQALYALRDGDQAEFEDGIAAYR